MGVGRVLLSTKEGEQSFSREDFAGLTFCRYRNCGGFDGLVQMAASGGKRPS